ncbi:hypothetical protein DPMN_013665 [Dreissena polymorpha]|uniref:Uncharacterized protein n=1 Tax=Dreissena polymorpha TaxID=45954 RepID=A0A9D4S2Q0_DREPO|nr:hypothetical protein DPMN_013665 [Dreissena polymorpha]
MMSLENKDAAQRSLNDMGKLSTMITVTVVKRAVIWFVVTDARYHIIFNAMTLLLKTMTFLLESGFVIDARLPQRRSYSLPRRMMTRPQQKVGALPTEARNTHPHQFLYLSWQRIHCIRWLRLQKFSIQFSLTFPKTLPVRPLYQGLTNGNGGERRRMSHRRKQPTSLTMVSYLCRLSCVLFATGAVECPLCCHVITARVCFT